MSKVNATVEYLELPTYQPGPDSPYPSFIWENWRCVYPYSMRQDVSEEARPAKHRAVVLENKFVKVVVLPDLGGKIFQFYDKVNKQDCFMVPPSIKFQNIAPRGSWIAGGIELNFGAPGHTVHTVDPVTWSLRQDDDGGASVWIGSVIRPLESRYSVRIRLAPDRAAMDMEIHTAAPAGLPGQMYYWTNTAEVVGPNSRFYYFGMYSDTGGVKHSWPVADGLDYSWYRNRPHGSDMFLMDTRRDYLGFYDFDRHHGVANTASKYAAPGQKYFTWGNDQNGRYWDLMLSDSSQTYCEIQRGRLPSQTMCEPMPPGCDETWTETWVPLPQTEGLSALEGDLVLSVDNESSPSQAVVRLLALRPMKNLRLEAFSGEKSLGKTKLESLTFGQPAIHTFKLTSGKHCDRVQVRDADGTLLLDWEEFQHTDTDWWSDIPKYKYKEDTASQEETFLEAQQLRYRTWPHPSADAERLYKNVLEKDPGHTGALAAMAEVDIFAGDNARAVERLTKALERSPRNYDLHMLLGWAYFRAGQTEKAADWFGTAARYENLRRDGLYGAALCSQRLGNLERAMADVEAILADRPADKWARVLKVALLRKTGQAGAARALLEELLAQEPLWSRLHAEALLLGVKVNIYDGRRKLGDDSVSAALPYIELEQWADAKKLLTVDESNDAFSPAVRLAHLAYVQHRSGDKALAGTLRQLAKAPVAQASPWAVGSMNLLRELVAANDGHAMLHYLYGTMLAHRAKVEEARKHWQRAVDLGLEDTVVYRCLTKAAIHLGDKKAAEKYAAKCWELAGNHVAGYAEYDCVLAAAGKNPRRLEVYAALPAAVKRRSMAEFRFVAALVDNGKYEQALEELRTRQFLPAEFDRSARTLYLQAVLGQAGRLVAAGKLEQAQAVARLGLEYPRNQNTGKSAVWGDEAMINYLIGVLSEGGADSKQTAPSQTVREFYLAAVTEIHPSFDPQHAYEMLAWAAMGNRLRAMGMAHTFEKANRGEETPPGHLEWIGGSPLLALAHGLGQLLKGHPDEAREIWQQGLAKHPEATWLRVHLDLPEAMLARLAHPQAP